MKILKRRPFPSRAKGLPPPTLGVAKSRQLARIALNEDNGANYGHRIKIRIKRCYGGFSAQADL